MQYPLKSLLKGIYLRIRKALLSPFLFLRKTEALPKKEIKSILFLRHDRIGDMVVSTAALKALRKTFPDARITVLASDRNHEVIENSPNVDEIVVYKGFYWFVKEMRARRIDLTIDPFYTYELKQAFISHLSGARYRIGFEEAGREIFFNLKGPGIYPAKQFVDHMLELIACLGGDVKGYKPELFLTEEEGQWASRFLSEKGIDSDGVTVAIHPGGYYETQRWPAERFGFAAKRLVDELKANVIVIGGGQGEVAVVNSIKEICGDHVSIISDISIRQLIAILGKCDLFLGNNSGPLHIAAALGLPTVSITGPTVFPLWLPYGDNHIVLRKELDCSPCNRAICLDHSCMELITVEEVMEAVVKQLRVR
ncbi:MAG: glycosyltransferase family 9 protein [Thermodesulfobacteriota bacterium]